VSQERNKETGKCGMTIRKEKSKVYNKISLQAQSKSEINSIQHYIVFPLLHGTNVKTEIIV
jgi:hypothetical protein